MKKMVFVAMLTLMLGLLGCSSDPFGQAAGTGVVFDGAPLIVDPAVIHMGSVVGQILSRQWSNGITRLTITIEKDSQNLKRSNMAAVVVNGQLHLVRLGGVGEALSAQDCFLGFNNKFSLQWFKIKNIINNVNMAATRKAQWRCAISGLSG